MSSYNIRPATPADYEPFAELLQSENLPVKDIDPAMDNFLLVEDRGAIAGGIGMEMYKPYALLRSMVTASNNRRQGLASRLVEVLLDNATNENIETVYLITNTAESFFEKKGFRQIDRTAVPDAVKASAEFNGLCPDSATVMFFQL